MIGYRLWGLGSKSGLHDYSDYVLTSVGVNHLWSSRNQGSSIEFLVDPYSDNSVGYQLSTKSYFDQEFLESILPDFDLDDPRWEDDNYWNSEYSDYLVWDWIANSGSVCPNYGFHAYSSMKSLMNDSLYAEMGAFVIGVVSGYGKIHKHKKGFRSEFMNVRAIAYEEDDSSNALIYCQDLQRWKINKECSTSQVLDVVSNNLDIPLVSMEDIFNMEKQYVLR